MKKGTYKNIISGRRILGRCILAGLLLSAVSGLTACSNNDMDPLVKPKDKSSKITEKNTITVERGDIEPVFEGTLNLAGYNEITYRVETTMEEELYDVYEVSSQELYVEVGDQVKKGDLLLAFKSDTLDEKLEKSEIEKTQAALEIEHLQRLQSIDSSQDFSSEIKDLNEKIRLANLYIADVNKTYASINMIAEEDGTVSFVDESVKDGFIVIGSPSIKVVSDSGYYEMAAPTEKSQGDEDAILDEGDYSFIKFNEGDQFTAKTALAEYKVEVIPKPENGNDRTIYFKLIGDVGVKEKTLLLQDVQETEKNVCYVDKRAVCPYKGKYYVLKEMENGNFRAVEVKLGSSVGMNIVVEEGLEEGDIVSMID